MGWVLICLLRFTVIVFNFVCENRSNDLLFSSIQNILAINVFKIKKKKVKDGVDYYCHAHAERPHGDQMSSFKHRYIIQFTFEYD